MSIDHQTSRVVNEDEKMSSPSEIMRSSAFERLRYKIILSKKTTLSDDEIILYARLCSADRDERIPYSLVIDLNSLRKRGVAEATYLAGLFYRDGIKPYEHDEKKAFACFEEAYQSGFTATSRELSECYFKGIGCDKDYARAEALLVGLQDEDRYRTYLGFIYIEEGREEGWDMLFDSNRREEIESFYYLGLAYKDSRYHHQDHEKSRLFFRIGSDLGEERCHLEAGRSCLESRDPFIRSLARGYLERASDAPEARYILSDIISEEEKKDAVYRLDENQDDQSWDIMK